LDDGSACALERVAPATYAGVELEIGQGDPHCYLQSSKSISTVGAVGRRGPTDQRMGRMDGGGGGTEVGGGKGCWDGGKPVLLHFFVSIYLPTVYRGLRNTSRQISFEFLFIKTRPPAHF
jgi:hypothetical protein